MSHRSCRHDRPRDICQHGEPGTILYLHGVCAGIIQYSLGEPLTATDQSAARDASPPMPLVHRWEQLIRITVSVRISIVAVTRRPSLSTCARGADICVGHVLLKRRDQVACMNHMVVALGSSQSGQPLNTTSQRPNTTYRYLAGHLDERHIQQ